MADPVIVVKHNFPLITRKFNERNRLLQEVLAEVRYGRAAGGL